jgi:hypothetical protein
MNEFEARVREFGAVSPEELARVEGGGIWRDIVRVAVRVVNAVADAIRNTGKPMT